jgi:ligand-binding sensor domain-containing protein
MTVAYKLWIAFVLGLSVFNPYVNSLQPSTLTQNGYVITACHALYDDYFNELWVALDNED